MLHPRESREEIHPLPRSRVRRGLEGVRRGLLPPPQHTVAEELRFDGTPKLPRFSRQYIESGGILGGALKRLMRAA